jgi:GNAT superfamily N-acetyltransferase
MALYGQSGTGKTSFAAQFPNVLFVVDPKEEGIEDLKASGQVRQDIPVLVASKWEELTGITDELISADHPYRYVAFDALTGFEAQLFDFVKRTEFKNDWEKFHAYGKGPETAVPELNSWLNKLEDLRRKGVGVLLIAHSKVKTFNDPLRESYDRIIFDNHEKVMNAVLKWASDVGYIDFEVKIEEEGLKNKARGGNFRLHLNRQAAFEAKNRSGVKQPIPMPSPAEGFKNFVAAVSAAKKAGTANKEVAA